MRLRSRLVELALWNLCKSDHCVGFVLTPKRRVKRPISVNWRGCFASELPYASTRRLVPASGDHSTISG